MPRYKLRTLLILLAILPPLLWIGWGRYQAWRGEQERQRALAEMKASEAIAAQQQILARQAAQQAAMTRWESDLAKSRDSSEARRGVERLSDSIPYSRKQATPK